MELILSFLPNLQQKYNNMSEHQTLNMPVNESQGHTPMQGTQFRQHSSRDESIVVNDLGQGAKELREGAEIFLENYKAMEENFGIKRLRESKELRVKYFKESVYYGQFHGGKKHGLGVMVYKTGRVYEGEWFQDQKKGYGSEKFPNLSIYKGNYLNNKPNGTGTYIWQNGQRYDGQWQNGTKHGSGMWRGCKGDSYKGEWKYGKPDGYGVHTWPNGDTYEGEFKDCLKHGQGLEKFANGDMYKGSYMNGKPSGYGQYYWLNGSVSRGNFSNGLRNGKGVWKRGPGNKVDKYQGMYRNDKKWGQGTFTWASGNFYKGNYEADERNGYGEMYWNNGSYYKGNWLMASNMERISIPGEGYKRGKFNNNIIIEVWEQRLQQKNEEKPKSNKARIRIKTQKAPKYFNTKQESRNEVIKVKRMSAQQLRRKTSPGRTKNSLHNPTSPRRTKNSLHNKTSPSRTKKRLHSKSNIQVVQKLKSSQCQRIKRERYLFDQRQSFSSNNKNIGKQRIQTFTNQSIIQKQIVKPELNTSSKSRLLHSSFYLYKLNKRHIIQTEKNVSRIKNQSQNSQASMMFMGKLYPNIK